MIRADKSAITVSGDCIESVSNSIHINNKPLGVLMEPSKAFDSGSN